MNTSVIGNTYLLQILRAGEGLLNLLQRLRLHEVITNTTPTHMATLPSHQTDSTTHHPILTKPTTPAKPPIPLPPTPPSPFPPPQTPPLTQTIPRPISKKRLRRLLPMNHKPNLSPKKISTPTTSTIRQAIIQVSLELARKDGFSETFGVGDECETHCRRRRR